MALLNTADAVYVGGTLVDRVYLGDTLAWEAAPAGPTPFTVTWDFTGSSFLGTSDTAGIAGAAAGEGRPELQFGVQTSLGYASSPVLGIGTGVAATTAAAAVTADCYVTFPVECAGVWTPTEITLLAARGGAAAPRGIRFAAPTAPTTLLAGGGDITSVRPTFQAVTIPLDIGTLTGNATFRMYFYAPTGTSTIEVDDVAISGILGA